MVSQDSIDLIVEILQANIADTEIDIRLHWSNYEESKNTFAKENFQKISKIEKSI